MAQRVEMSHDLNQESHNEKSQELIYEELKAEIAQDLDEEIPQALDKFTRFTELPAELRVQIYNYDIHRERALSFCHRNGDHRRGPLFYYNYGAKALKYCRSLGCQGCVTDHLKFSVRHYSVPAFLHVSAETRKEALKTFRKVLVHFPSHPGRTGVNLKLPLYFNPGRDTFHFQNSYDLLLRGPLQPTLKQAYSVAIESVIGTRHELMRLVPEAVKELAILCPRWCTRESERTEKELSLLLIRWDDYLLHGKDYVCNGDEKFLEIGGVPRLGMIYEKMETGGT